MHVTDDILILHRYGETTPDEAREIAGHLAACARCRAAWDELSSLTPPLDREAVPDPDEGFEDRTWAAVRAAIHPVAPSGRGPMRHWILTGAMAAGVGALVLGAASLRPSTVPPPAVAARVATEPGQRVLYTAFDEHLDQAEVLLVELMNTRDASPDALAYERNRADDLVSTGRLYRVTAEQQGEWQIARMLDALEPVFVEVARAPEPSDARQVESLQARIDDSTLLFEVRALRTSLRGIP